MATIYFKLIIHLKYILMGNESMVNPKIIINVYFVGPYAENIFLRKVFANKAGKTII